MNNRIVHIRFDPGGEPKIELCLRNGESVLLEYKRQLRFDYVLVIAQQQIATGSALGEVEINAIIKKLKARYSKRTNAPRKFAGIISKLGSFHKIWLSDLTNKSDREQYSKIIVSEGSEFEQEPTLSDLLCEFYHFDSESRSYCLVSSECSITFPSSAGGENSAVDDCRRPERDEDAGLKVDDQLQSVEPDSNSTNRQEVLKHPKFGQCDPSSEDVRSDDPSLDSEIVAYLSSLKTRVSAPHLFMDTGHHDWRVSGLNLQRICLSLDANKKAAASYGGNAKQPDVMPTEQRMLIDELTCENCHQKVRIEGDAGVGKTTFLEEICWTVACDPQSRRIPLVARLDQWSEFVESARDKKDRTLLNFLVFGNTSLSTTFIRRLCQNNRALVLLDGLDEIRSDDARVALAQWLDENANSLPFQQCPFILTGRPWAFTQSAIRTFGQRVVTLKPLNRDDIEQYIRVYFTASPELGRSLSHHVRTTPQVYHLITTPLLLAMLCFVWRHDQSKSAISETRILSRAMRHLVKRRSSQIRQELKGSAQLSSSICLRLLSLLAWTSWLQSSGTYLHEDDALEALGHALENDRVISRELRNAAPSILLGALVRHAGVIGAEDDLRYRFTNHRVLEYLAGRHLAGFERKELIDVFARNAWNPRWQGVFIHMAAELSNGSPAKQKLGRSLVRWLLLESQDDRDDIWGALVLLGAGMAGSGPELLPLENENRKVFSKLAFRAWRYAVNTGCVEQENAACIAFGRLAAILPDPCMGDLLGLFERSKLILGHPFYGNSRYGVATVRTLAVTGRDEGVDFLISIVGKSFGLSCGVSEAAVGALGELGVERALRHIIDDAFKRVFFLRSPVDIFIERYKYVRFIDAVRRIDAASAAQYIRTRLKSDEPQHRALACVFLSELRDGSSVGELTRLVKNECDLTTREWAIDALGRLGATEVVEMLIQLLSVEEEYSTKVTVLYALARIGTRRAAEAIAANYLNLPVYSTKGESLNSTELWGTVPRALAKSILIRQLHGSDEKTQANAMMNLAVMKCHEIVPILVESAKIAESVLVRMGAVGSLGLLGTSESVDYLISLAMDSNEEKVIRSTSMDSLRWIANQDSSTRSRIIEPMIMLLDDNDIFLRRVAVKLLRSYADQRAVPHLAVAANDSDEEVRLASIAALGGIREESGVPVLQGLLKHADAKTRTAALRALGRIGSADAVDSCGQALSGAPAEAQCRVLEAMGNSNTVEAANYCARSLSNAKPSVREQAARSLGEIGGEDVVEHLGRALADDETGVRNAAAAGLQEIRLHKAVEFLWSAGRTQDAAVLCETLGCTILVDDTIVERESLLLNERNRPDSS